MKKSKITNYKMFSQRIPKGMTVIDTVTTKNKPIGSVLVLSDAGIYALINDGAISSVDQEEAKNYHKMLLENKGE